MWRALFFAVGVMLIVLGVECLVVKQCLISQRTRIPTMIARMLDGDGVDRGAVAGQYPSAGGTSGPSPWNAISGSRFQASPYSPQQDTNRGGNSGFSLTGFGGSNAKPSATVGPHNPKGLREIKTKDWMPWSLLAAGTLVVLYTNSTRRSFSGD